METGQTELSIGARIGAVVAKNNIISSSTSTTYALCTTPCNTSGDHNLWYGLGSGPSWSTTGDLDNTADPLFSDAANGDFSLQAISEAIGAATDPTSILTTDYYGKALSSPYDMGAIRYEVQTATHRMSGSGAVIHGTGSYR